MASKQNIATLSVDEVFQMLAVNDKNQLRIEDFKQLCKWMFCQPNGTNYDLDNFTIQQLFTMFDKNQDNLIDREEFQWCWDNWVKVVLQPKAALLVIDVQNDFISGTLNISNAPAKQNGSDVIAPINALLDTVSFPMVAYSLDYHPPDHISFIENVALRELDASSPVQLADVQVFDEVVFKGPPQVTQRLWPAHCVQGSWGAQLHPRLNVVQEAVMLHKGTDPNIDSYSAFFDNQHGSQTELHTMLQQAHVTDVYVCGLAWDFCVGHTALHALELGYRTVLLRDCTKALDLQRAQDMEKQIIDHHGMVIDSSRVSFMVNGQDRLPELGYKLAIELKNL